MPENPESINEMDELLAWFDPDRDRAAELLLALRRRLMFYFRFYHDPESLADVAIDRVLKNIRDGKVEKRGSPENYTWGVARYLKMEKHRERKIFSLDENTKLPSNEPAAPSSEDKDAFEKSYQSVLDCLTGLGNEGTLFLRYYSETNVVKQKKLREELAAETRLNLKALRVKIFRIKEKIIKCLEKMNKVSLLM